MARHAIAVNPHRRIRRRSVDTDISQDAIRRIACDTVRCAAGSAEAFRQRAEIIVGNVDAQAAQHTDV